MNQRVTQYKSYNRGEWAESFCFAQLLVSGRIYDENGGYFDIAAIRRNDGDNGSSRIYTPFSPDGHVTVDYQRICVPELPKLADGIYPEFLKQRHTGATFVLKSMCDFLALLGTDQIKANSKQKDDLGVQFCDPRFGNRFIDLNIKANWGGPPGIVNASKRRRFRYAIRNCSTVPPTYWNDKKGCWIEAKDTPKNIVKAIYDHGGSLELVDVPDTIFRKNIEHRGEGTVQMLAAMQIQYLRTIGRRYIIDLIDDCMQLYEFGFTLNEWHHNIANFLYQHAVGGGDGEGLYTGNGDEASGGFITIVGPDIYIQGTLTDDVFRTNLLRDSFIDTASRSRHEFGRPYNEDGNLFIDNILNVKLGTNG